MIDPELPGGFRDALPEDAIAKEAMIEIVKGVYERFGYDPMQTSAIERTEVLTGGESESAKIIFNVKGSRDEADSSDTSFDKAQDKSLRFDLTVPLARVLAKNPDIAKPFKRYQIAKVWRGERSQAGRYREFIQADIDILGVKSPDADAEIIQVMYETMKALGIDEFMIRLNNKEEALKLLDEVGVPEDRTMATLIAVDKKDKILPDEWADEVAGASGLEDEKLKEYLWKISGENLLDSTSIRELRQKVEAFGVPQKYLIYDASLVRGLGYYTGTVFEILLTDLPNIGTIFAGGRYDGLTNRFSKDSTPAVGASLGIDRLYAALETIGTIQKRKTLVQVLIFNLADEFASDYARFASATRAYGINTALYLGDDRAFQNQLAYAVKKEIPFILLYGEKERASGKIEIKDLRSGKQESVEEKDLAAYIKTRL